MPSTAATFYDGVTSRRQSVEVSLHPEGVAIFDAQGYKVATWPYGMIRRIEGYAGSGLAVTRQPEPGSNAEPRLEIPNPDFAAELAGRSPLTLTRGVSERRERRAVVLWALAAIVSLAGVVIWGIPALAARIAPLVPTGIEMRLGESLDPQIRSMFGAGQPVRTCSGEAGKAVLDELVGRFERASELHLPLKVVVLRHSMVNAFAIPGGRVYIMDGLLQRARSPDELAGVLAHEIGHVKLRHGMERVIHEGGVGFLLGTVFGDFAGGTAIIFASRTLISSAFSRDAERAADRFAVDLMLKAGGDPMGLARFFANFNMADPGALAWLASHPANAEREQAIRDAVRDAGQRAAALTPEQWTALRSICQKVE